jgi:hypothetical protein
MLEAVLVLAAAVADAFGPRWALLTEIALLRHQARRPSTLGCQAARGAIRPNRPGRTRRCHPDVEERPAHRPTRDPSSLAPRRLQGSLAVAEPNAARVAPRYGGGRACPVHGLGEHTLGPPRGSAENYSSSASRSASSRSRSTCGRRPARPRGQRWSTFLRNHAQEIWACDFLQAYDVFFRSIFAFVFIELATRKVMLAASRRRPG